mgnify:FL=1
MNNLRSTFGLFALAVVLMPFKAMAVDPPVNPGNGSGAKEFNWQDEWGTIHMNSLADGLNDPGSPASSNGSVGCPTGGLCKDGKVKSSVNTGFPTQIGNGIKFDIKNSLLNCMSKVVTNWAVYNPWDSDTTVCLSQYGLYPPKDKAHDAHTLLYLPIYDRRSNDGREWQNVSEVGCQQQIINNCARDEGGNEIIREIHQCIQSPSSDYQIPPPPAFAAHPVTHVFTKEEVQDQIGRAHV